jgi:hypothetical protein
VTNVDEIKHAAKGVVVNQVDRRTTQLGNVIGGHVSTLRDMSDSLRDQGQDATAQLVDLAAERLNRVSTYLTATDGDRIIHDIENVARRQPMIAAAAGFAAGVAAARLLKAGAAQRYRRYSADMDYGVR